MSVILGYGGYVQLSREWPEPTVFPQSSRAGSNAIFCQDKAFWTGQRVLIYSYLGLPVRTPGQQYAPCPEGHRFWGGSSWVQGPETAHRGSGNTIFWKPDVAPLMINPGTPGDPADDFIVPGTLQDPADDFFAYTISAGFWETQLTTGFDQVIEAYINRDQLDRITFYTSENGAINRSPDQLITFSNVDYKNLLIAPYSSSTDYQIAFEALGQFLFEDMPQREQGASAYVDLPEEMTSVADDPEQRGWSILVGCREWTLQTDPTVLDTTAIGEDFGDSVKDVVRGSGSFNGFIPVSNPSSGSFDARGFIRLMLMTETGSKARVRLRVQDQRSVGCEKEDAVWIEADILLGPGEIGASVDEAINYSSQFVVVKDKDGIGIKPLIGPFS